MKAAAYIRVSTETQTTDNQLMDVAALCKARGWELVKVYSENASAWASGRQTIIVVWGLDRLTREGPLRILSLTHQLKKDCAGCNSPYWNKPKVKYRGQRQQS